MEPALPGAHFRGQNQARCFQRTSHAMMDGQKTQFPSAELTMSIDRMNIRLLGAYLPRLTPERIARHVEEDRLRFINVGVPDLQRQGFVLDWSKEDIAERSFEIAEEMAYCIERAALFEVVVSQADLYFEPGVFENAWEPAFLDIDGLKVIAESVTDLDVSKPFRLVFWVHDWTAESVLDGPNGPVPIERFEPVPERLWDLAPYDIVD
ncbi:MAG: hypothetical protein U5L74_11875 [Ideonella sp.]|nr:hypothetical protein [Ideonella sp.]